MPTNCARLYSFFAVCSVPYLLDRSAFEYIDQIRGFTRNRITSANTQKHNNNRLNVFLNMCNIQLVSKQKFVYVSDNTFNRKCKNTQSTLTQIICFLFMAVYNAGTTFVMCNTATFSRRSIRSQRFQYENCIFFYVRFICFPTKNEFKCPK